MNDDGTEENDILDEDDTDESDEDVVYGQDDSESDEVDEVGFLDGTLLIIDFKIPFSSSSFSTYGVLRMVIHDFLSQEDVADDAEEEEEDEQEDSEEEDAEDENDNGEDFIGGEFNEEVRMKY